MNEHRLLKRKLKMLGMGIGTGLLLAAMLTVPILWIMHNKQEPTFVDNSKLNVSVYLSQQKKTSVYRLETYVRGVLAAEMPADFELEALKAQAIASRTYIVKRLGPGPTNASQALGGQASNQASNASNTIRLASTSAASPTTVTDTVAHQTFLTDDKLKAIWGADEYKRRMKRVERAVMETEGIVATYSGQPIDAAFFSTASGRTENSEDYWSKPIPYLRSVSSPWDKAVSPKYKQIVNIKLTDFANALGIQPKNIDKLVVGQHIKFTNGGKIQQITIANQSFTGRQVRERLRLASAKFKLKRIADTIQVTTYGYGHGIGMSQYGAQGMALAGFTADQILKHYYTGITLQKIQSN